MPIKGYKFSEEAKAHMGASQLGRKHSEETKAKMRAWHLGRPKSPEHRARISTTLKGRPRSPEAAAASGAGHRGKPLSKTLRAKISLARKGWCPSEETRKRMCIAAKRRIQENGNPFKGRRHTEATKAIIRAKMVRAMQNGKVWPSRGRPGWFRSKKTGKNLHYRSLLELGWYQCLEAQKNVLWYEVETVAISYYWQSSLRTYIPDLRVWYADGTVEVLEVKPEGVWWRAEDRNIAKWKAARKWCRKRAAPHTFRVVGYVGLKGSRK